MKKIAKDFTQVPSILLSQRCLDLIADSLKTKGKHNFNGDVYGNPEVRQELDDIYNNQCAFCESDTTAGASMQVEHYRPKAKVTEDTKHPGYYWLGYEWSNLLLSCARCNRKKHNHFELSTGATYQQRPPMTGGHLDRSRCLITTRRLVAEQALLLNPEIESDVRQHFAYDDSGQITGITTPGANTVLRAGLDRKPLNVARKKVLGRCLIMISRAIKRYYKGVNTMANVHGAIMAALDELLQVYLENEPYSEYAFHCWQNVPSYIIQVLPAQFQPTAQSAYQKILQALPGPVV